MPRTLRPPLRPRGGFGRGGFQVGWKTVGAGGDMKPGGAGTRAFSPARAPSGGNGARWAGRGKKEFPRPPNRFEKRRARRNYRVWQQFVAALLRRRLLPGTGEGCSRHAAERLTGRPGPGRAEPGAVGESPSQRETGGKQPGQRAGDSTREGRGVPTEGRGAFPQTDSLLW